MDKKNILFICGSINQTTMMHKISRNFDENMYDMYFSAYYTDSPLHQLVKRGYLKFTILGDKLRSRAEAYMRSENLRIDYRGMDREYDLVYTCSDLIIPYNIRKSKIVLVQEGMTDPENFVFHVVKNLKLPRWMASTSTTGLSHLYDYFCVASEGYKDHFIKKGTDPEKLIVTGIPNFDNAARFLDNDFPHKDYVMVATSDARETFKYENRKKFIYEALDIADGRQLLFKFHPNEHFNRAAKEVEKYAPGALWFTKGNTDHMIANCSTLVTKYSSVVYVGLALGKDVHSYFDLEELKRMTPIQNGGTSAVKIAEVGKKLLGENSGAPVHSPKLIKKRKVKEVLNT